jgi:outer membrane protein OmpU
MNKLTKVGLSALCGSLATISAANAGEMTVTGGVDMSWVSLGGGDATTGNPIGMGSNLTFTGSGELDNGWTFGITVAMLNQDAYSNTAINIDMGGLGSLNLNQGDSGNGIDALDDKMPTAWEEPWGNALGTGVQLVRGVGPESNVQYKTPTILGTNITVAHAPEMGTGNVNDKSSSGSGSGSGYDATINMNPSLGTEILSGLNLFVGAHTSGTNGVAPLNDRYEGTGGITYDIGPISLGYAASGISTGKVASSAVDYYKNHMYGVAFNVNDDLSISYGSHESQQGFVNMTDTASVHMDMESLQIAYTMGGASFRYAMTEVTNAAYQTANQYDKEANVLSVSLAF